MNYNPKTVEELNDYTRKLYNKIIKNNKIRGTIKLDNERIDYITWNIYKNYIIEISFDYHGACIDIKTKEKGEIISLTHWHPEFSEVYDDFLELNDKNNIIVIKVKRMSGGHDVINKNAFNRDKFKNNFFHKYYIIGEE